jgi:hypothetical protein
MGRPLLFVKHYFSHDSITAKRVSIQLIHIRRRLCPQRIQTDVSEQLQKVAIFLA